MSVNDFDEVMEEIGFGRVHFYALVTNGLIQMLVINETMGMGIVGPTSVCDLKMNLVQLAALTSAGFLGIICSSYFWGYIADKMGRRWLLLRTLTLCNLCSLVSMLMIYYTHFFMARFIMGIFVAGPSFVAVTYFSEFCTRKIMSRVVTYMYIFTGFGMIYCPSLAQLFLAQSYFRFHLKVFGDVYFHTWRAFGCLFFVPGLIAVILLLFLPESPKFQFMVGNTQGGMDVMNWVSIKNTGHPLTEEQVLKLLSFQTYAQVKRRREYGSIINSMLRDAMPLFRKPYMRTYICCCWIMFTLGLLTHGLGIWFTNFRNQANSHPRQSASFCNVIIEDPATLGLSLTCHDVVSGFKDSIILGVVYIIMCNVFWLVLTFVRRKLLLLTALFVTSISGILLQFVHTNLLQKICMMVFLAVPGTLISLMGGALLEFVPTFLRAKAMCICLIWCRWGAVVGTNIIGFFIESYCEGTFVVLTMFPIISIIVAIFLPL